MVAECRLEGRVGIARLFAARSDPDQYQPRSRRHMVERRPVDGKPALTGELERRVIERIGLGGSAGMGGETGKVDGVHFGAGIPC